MQMELVADLRTRIGRELAEWMFRERLTPDTAAQRLGISEHGLRLLIDERPSDFSIGELLKIWWQAGGRAEIVLHRDSH